MSKFELIDDFLSNRLSDGEKVAFEQEAASDPSLKADLDLQRQIIEGVRSARMIELKSMLNNVPVSGGNFGTSATAFKIAASVLSVAVVGTVVYFAVPKPKQEKNGNKSMPRVMQPVAPGKRTEANDSEKVAPIVEVATPSKAAPLKKEDAKSAPKTGQEPADRGQVQQPKIDVVDPSEDMADSKGKESSTNASHKSSNASRIAVDTDASNRKYNFHYQFSGTKLVLFGNFDKGLYEILEINAGEKSVFLFYKGDYYLLNDKQNAITPLVPIRDAALIQKLKEYRGG